MTAQERLQREYGAPSAAYLREHCIIWQVQNDFKWFPVGHFLVNDELKALLFNAFTALEKGGLHTEIKTFDGCYNDRSVRGRGAISLHAWAAAIDLNAETNGMVEHPTDEQRRGGWSEAFIDTMKKAGLFFGGDFIERADPMHWALLDG